MSRKALDLLFATGGALLAVTLLVLGFVMMDQKAFADDYVKEELGAQRIVFAEADKLTEEEKNWKEGSSCLVKYAGQRMETGKQAECYGKYYIGMHMARSATNQKFSAPIKVTLEGQEQTLTTMEGQTYATIGTIRTALAADQKALADSGNKAAADARQKDVDAAASLRTTMQTGETLRGLLLTTYGFHSLGDRAGLAATVAFIAAAILAIVAAGGFVHAFLEARKTSTSNTPVASAPGKPIEAR